MLQAYLCMSSQLFSIISESEIFIKLLMSNIFFYRLKNWVFYIFEQKWKTKWNCREIKIQKEQDINMIISIIKNKQNKSSKFSDKKISKFYIFHNIFWFEIFNCLLITIFQKISFALTVTYCDQLLFFAWILDL